MNSIKFKGTPVNLCGEFIKVGAAAPDFTLTGSDLSDVTLKSHTGKRIVLNIFPSLDTAVCAASVRKFNSMAAKIENTVVLAISKDLPFAHGRFCTTEGIENVTPLSAFRNCTFGEDYGVEMADGPLAGLFARSVIVLDENGKIVHTQLVPEITTEPDYDAALKAL